MNPLFKTSALTLSLALAACGGGGGDNSNANSDNDPRATEPTSLSISGKVQFAENLVADLDLNSSTQSSNNSEQQAQLLPNNLVQVQGFVAAEDAPGTETIDTTDTYRVFLQAGQEITLDVASFSKDPANGGNLSLKISTRNTGFQSQKQQGAQQLIVAPEDTDYLIEVTAESGFSRYVLTLGAATPQFPDTQSGITSGVGIGNSALGDPSDINIAGRLNDIPDFVLKQAIVKWKTAADGWAFDTVDLTEIYTSDNLDWSKAATTKAAIELLNKRADVAYAEPNYFRQLQAVTPNDPLYGAPLEAQVYPVVNGAVDLSQVVGTLAINEDNNATQVVDSSFISQYHYEQIKLPQAWDTILTQTTQQPGDGVIVAVADTGLFLEHEDLRNKLTTDGFDFISNAAIAKDNESDGITGDIDSNPDDPGDGDTIATSSWHGTHVAGTIAAETNNNVGVAGVAWESRIMPLRVLGAGGGSNSDIMNALIYAADLFSDLKPQQKADVINLSLGGGSPSQAEQEVINAVREAGVFVVAAAGNEGNAEFSFPASYDGVISVAAINGQKQRAFYSQFNNQVDVAAPGGQFLGINGNPDLIACVGILSTYVAEAVSPGIRASATNCLQGTSMATPHVSGVIALMKSVYPDLTPNEFDELLASGEISDDLGANGRDDAFGHGLINAEKAVDAAIRLAGNQPLQNPILKASLDNIELDQGSSTVSLTLLNVNEAAENPAVTVQTSADWITVDASQTENGIGTYQVIADTTGFGTGNYKGLIRFSPATGKQVEVKVALTVGSPERNHPQARHFIVFIDSEGSNAGTATVQNDGAYSLELPLGTYRVVSGTDIDQDLIVCQFGETCGTVTSLLSGDRLNLSTNLTDVDLRVQLLDSKTTQPALFRRSEVQESHGAFAVLR